MEMSTENRPALTTLPLSCFCFFFFFFRPHWHVGILVTIRDQTHMPALKVQNLTTGIAGIPSSMLSAGWLIGFIGW